TAFAEIGALLLRGAAVFLVRQRLARRLRQIALARLQALFARAGSPLFPRPLHEVIVGSLRPHIAAAATLILLHGQLRLARRPLTGVPALLGSRDLRFDLF